MSVTRANGGACLTVGDAGAVSQTCWGEASRTGSQFPGGVGGAPRGETVGVPRVLVLRWGVPSLRSARRFGGWVGPLEVLRGEGAHYTRNSDLAFVLQIVERTCE